MGRTGDFSAMGWRAKPVTGRLFRRSLVKRLLRPPMKSRQIRIFAAGGLVAVGFFRLTLDAARFFLALLHLFRFFTVAFGERCFGWFSDGVLLVRVE